MLIAPHPQRVSFPGAALLLCMLLFAGCAGSATTRLPAPTVTPLPTATAVPTATPSPAPAATATPTLQLLNVPSGWQVYNGPHFAIALPPGWTVDAFPQGNSTPSKPAVAFGLRSPTGRSDLSVHENDGLTVADIQQVCSVLANRPVVTFASLPMRFSASEGGGISRDWAFVSDKGSDFDLQALDGFSSADVKSQDEAILGTFRPEFTVSGCN